MSGVNLQPVVSNNSTTDEAANQQRLFAGKYKTVEELERGYANSQTEANKIIAERNDLAKKTAILETLMRGQGNDRVMPSDRIAARTSPIDALTENLNVDRATLVGALTEIVGQQLAPITGVLAAQQRVNADIPDFGKFQPEIAQFLSANPEVSAEYETMIRNPDTAAAGMRYAYLMYKANAPAAASQNSTTTTDMSGQAQAQARLDAMIPNGAGSGRAAALDASAQGERDALLAHGRRTGDWSGYLAWALGDSSQRTV